MRRLLYMLLFFLPVVACHREAEIISEPLQEDGAPDGRVRVTFTCSLPESSPATKALGESSELENLRLAVFGSSGHYKEYVTADLVSGPVPVEKTFTDKDGNDYTKWVDSYTFSAELKLSNTARTIHFLGNGPQSITIGDARDVLPNILGTHETAFWQMVSLPEIKAKTDDDGNYLNPEGGIREPGQDYLVDPATLSFFQDIPLIRNWAKIILRNNWGVNWGVNDEPESNFTPISFAVVNIPQKGTLVPYGGKTGFFQHYQDLGFDDLFDADGAYAYEGNLPEGTEFNKVIPSREAFENAGDPEKNPEGRVVLYDRRYDDNPEGASVNPDDEPAVYLYERPAPVGSIEPSYVIIYGKYKNADDPSLTDSEKVTGIYCYYKIDLMDGAEYYPIFRNFKYRIEIRRITSRGHDTPEEAAASAGSANVSADVNASHLSDISDGKRRMAVQPWMSHTFIEGDKDEDYGAFPGPAHLYVKFYDNITVNDPIINMSSGCVRAEVTPAGGGAIVNDEVVIGEPVNTPGSDYGWRPVYFKVAQPDLAISRTQTIRLSCKTDWTDTEEQALYREIVITLQPKQVMKVSCEKERILRYPGESQVVNIQIPDGLVESMFPLVFDVEALAMTLTADNSLVPMPVVPGKSIKPGNDKSNFHFQRTVTWEQYNAVRTTFEFEDDSRWKVFPCYFKTNCEYSATEIWVTNRFFNPASTSFTDYRSFKDARFTTSIPRSTQRMVSIEFGVSKEVFGDETEARYPNVYVQTKGLSLTGFESLGPDRWLIPSNTFTGDTRQLSFTPTTLDGNVSVTLSAEGESYEPATLTPWRFSNVGFFSAHALPSKWNDQWGSNGVFGRLNSVTGKAVLFGYSTDVDNPRPVVYYHKDETPLENLSSTKASDDLSKSSLHNSTYYGEDNFYWVEMKTLGTAGDSRITLNSVGYVEETTIAHRFTGDMLSKRVTATELKNNFSSSGSWTGISMDKNNYASIQITNVNDPSALPGTSANGLVLLAGQTYEIEVKLYVKNNAVQGELLNVSFEYWRDENKLPQKHSFADPVSPEESLFYPYLGNNAEYIWEMPEQSTEGKIQITVPNSRDAVIQTLRIWGFVGSYQ